MDLYTIIVDFRGGTYLAQHRAESATSALLKWAEDTEPSAITRRTNVEQRSLIEALRGDSITPVRGLVNTWCASALLSNSLALIHIIKTVELVDPR